MAASWRSTYPTNTNEHPRTAFRCCVSVRLFIITILLLSTSIICHSSSARSSHLKRIREERKKIEFGEGRIIGSSPRSRRSALLPSHDGGIHPREERSRTRNDAPAAVTLVRGRRVIARTCPRCPGEGIACREGSSRARNLGVFRYAAPAEVKQLGRGSAPLLAAAAAQDLFPNLFIPRERARERESERYRYSSAHDSL